MICYKVDGTVDRLSSVEAGGTIAAAYHELADALNAANAALAAKEAEIARLREVCKASLAYDAAIQLCANDPSQMTSFCTASGDTLDSLYDAWISGSRAALQFQPSPTGTPAPNMQSATGSPATP